MKKLEDIIGEFEKSTRNNKELSLFVKDFGYYFISQLEERDERIVELHDLLNQASLLAKEVVSDANDTVRHFEKFNKVNSRDIAELFFWKAMKG